MRRAAYIKALEEASKLPEEIPILRYYFNNSYNPRLQAISHIMKVARTDDKLFDGECMDILNWKEENAEDNDNDTTEQAKV